MMDHHGDSSYSFPNLDQHAFDTPSQSLKNKAMEGGGGSNTTISVVQMAVLTAHEPAQSIPKQAVAAQNSLANQLEFRNASLGQHRAEAVEKD
jgi:hypothetical protein